MVVVVVVIAMVVTMSMMPVVVQTCNVVGQNPFHSCTTEIKSKKKIVGVACSP